MIPGIANPYLPMIAFKDGEATPIPGIGFRVVEVTSTACAINDAPMTGKMPPTYYGTDHFDPLESLHFDALTATTLHVVTDPTPSAVPLPESGLLLLCVLLIPTLPKVWQGFGAFMKWFEAERGTGEGQNGWPK